ncbi:PepSY-associated TM helix domain-containing protein [Kibdelosporangium phytohabitans]|uniref:Peptidase n=1 Tax=Kibdelosporangium phytohabitans TaxID=860235 RepID=A0A0N7F4B7_9PSEU|nr:PepSY domain-containing protein [Kibdelosporangium phytohabitans]ALG10983.1 peptidase [Kibdelosporangium phytohabitans]MBE1462194.1 putative iron-regulated membrane protein [Kibdelosporangium phytohabitans]
MTTDELIAPGTTGPATPTRRGSLRPLLLRLHFYLGVFVGPFIFVAAFSGLLYIFTPQLERAIYAHELTVPVGQAKQPLNDQVQAAQRALPDATMVRVRPGDADEATTQVIFSRSDLAPSHWLTAYVDPYTSQVRGTLETYGSSQAGPVRTWIDELHRGLHLGDFGRLYSELAASWLWVVVLGGLVLWWGRRRPAKGKGRRRLLSWHATTGTWVAIVLLFLSATGLTWSQYAGDTITDLRAALSWQTPTLPAASGHGGHGAHSEHAGPSGPAVAATADQVRNIARRAGLDGPIEIAVPSEPGAAHVVKQIRTEWPTKVDSAAIDATTGQVLATLRFDDYPLGAKLARWGIDAHMGVLFGLPNQIVLAAVCVAVLALIVWGYRMWWHRRPTKGGFGVGRPFPRGAWRSVPTPVLIGLIAVTAVLAWYLPVLGVSLIGFLLVDSAVGWAKGGPAVPARR